MGVSEHRLPQNSTRSHRFPYLPMGQNRGTLVNIEIYGKWMFIHPGFLTHGQLPMGTRQTSSPRNHEVAHAKEEGGRRPRKESTVRRIQRKHHETSILMENKGIHSDL